MLPFCMISDRSLVFLQLKGTTIRWRSKLKKLLAMIPFAGRVMSMDRYLWHINVVIILTCYVKKLVQVLECRQCPRVFHQRCVQIQSPVPPKWICPECVSIRNADKHSQADIDQLPDMLNFAMERIKSVTDSQPFFKPVDTEEFPQYTEYIVCPVDISQLEEKIAQKHYNSTRAFLADFRWILHNCIIFNSFHSKLTSTARTLMKVRSIIKVNA